MNAYNARQRLTKDVFGDDGDQYVYLPSYWYCSALETRGHRTNQVVIGGQFDRFAVLYRVRPFAGVQYASDGLVLDGTLLKDSIGGILLIACFQNGNSEIQIVTAAVVSGEGKENWTWFMSFLMPRLLPVSAFIISARHQGLISAGKAVYPAARHYQFVHHSRKFLSDNFELRRGR